MSTNNGNRKKFLPFILGGVGLVIAYFAFTKISYVLNNEDTDNAQIESAMSPVLPRIAGYVEQLNIKDNQVVKAGDTLLRIDDRDLKLKVLQAETSLRNAEANLAIVKANVGVSGANVGSAAAGLETTNATIETANANVATAQANLEAAKIRVWKTTQDFERYKALLAQKSVTQQTFDGAKAEKETAEAQLVVAQKQVDAAQRQADVNRKQAGVSAKQEEVSKAQLSVSDKQIALAEAQVSQRKAELELSQLQLSYAIITAPISGMISRKNVQLGQFVNAGQQVCSIVQSDDVWVVANFKETQLRKMKAGQTAYVQVDAYPGKKFAARVESIAAATGARFSLLPPDNASGNFVKVVQRIPVKVVFTEKPDANFPLRTGMSVQVVVPI